jgi:hypothetical protein
MSQSILTKSRRNDQSRFVKIGWTIGQTDTTVSTSDGMHGATYTTDGTEAVAIAATDTFTFKLMTVAKWGEWVFVIPKRLSAQTKRWQTGDGNRDIVDWRAGPPIINPDFDVT